MVLVHEDLLLGVQCLFGNFHFIFKLQFYGGTHHFNMLLILNIAQQIDIVNIFITFLLLLVYFILHLSILRFLLFKLYELIASFVISNKQF